MEMWKPEVVEESLAVIGWPKHSCTDDPENQVFIAYFHIIIVFFLVLFLILFSDDVDSRTSHRTVEPVRY